MLFKKTIIAFELLLSLSVWIFLIISELIIPENNLPYSYEALSAAVIVSTFLLSLPKLKKLDASIKGVQTLAISVTAFAAVHLSTRFSPTPELNFPALYFFVVLTHALLTEKYYWLFSYLILAGGETLSVFTILFSNNIPVNSTYITQNSTYSIIYLFLMGLIPSLLNRSLFEKNNTSIKPAVLVPPEHKTAEMKIHTQESKVARPQEPQSPSIPKPNQIMNANDFCNQTDDIPELLDSIVYFMSRNFKAHSALGFIFNPQNQSFELNSFQSKSLNISKGISIPVGKGIIGKIGVEKRPFMSGNLPLYNSEILYYNSPVEVNSILAVPIISDQQELLGALVLDCVEKNALKDQDKEIMRRFSTLAAALITNARTRAIQERSARTFKIFYQASHQFTTSLHLEDVFEVLFTTVPIVTNCTRQISIVFDENSNVGRILKVQGTGNGLNPGLEFNINRGLYSFVFQKRKLVNIGDYRQYQGKYYRFFPDELPDPSVRSLIIFPITDDEFRCRGIFSIESNTANQFVGETEQILSTLIENASVAFTRAVLYQKMELLATTDGLTGLNNHRNFQEILSKELERARRYKHPLSLLLMDIDHFKSFNDTYGHPVGDLVLKEISVCIQKSIRTNDIPARYGGEEFTVIIPETDQKNALLIAERVRSTIENHIIRSLDKELRVTVSIGCASFPSQVSSQQELIDSADKALYYSKEHGRNQVNMYHPSMVDISKMKKG